MVRKKQHEYTRLPGRQLFRVAGSNSLWMGKDHLLFIENYWFMESYKRFYYDDIQLVTIQKTSLTNLITIILCVLLSLAIFIAMPVGSRNFAAWFFAGLFVVLLLINLWLGPSCAFLIRTAVQSVRIPSIQRLRTARKVLTMVKPYVEQVQGQFDPIDIPAQYNITPERFGAVKEIGPAARASGSRYGGGFHKIFFPLLIIDGCLTLLLIFINNEFFILSMVLLNLVLILCVVGALARQNNNNTLEILRKLTWMGLGFVLFGYGLGYALVMWAFFNNPTTAQNQWELLKFIAGISFVESPVLLGVISVFAIVAFGLGGAGVAVRAKINSLAEADPSATDKIEQEMDSGLPD